MYILKLKQRYFISSFRLEDFVYTNAKLYKLRNITFLIDCLVRLARQNYSVFNIQGKSKQILIPNAENPHCEDLSFEQIVCILRAKNGRNVQSIHTN